MVAMIASGLTIYTQIGVELMVSGRRLGPGQRSERLKLPQTAEDASVVTGPSESDVNKALNRCCVRWCGKAVRSWNAELIS
jgi:hypothetical protein